MFLLIQKNQKDVILEAKNAVLAVGASKANLRMVGPLYFFDERISTLYGEIAN